MSNRVVVDPVTRIEGHLRIEAETDAAGRIRRASSAGTMVRGIELILKGRDPRDAWAFTQRICGVCTLVHGIASVRAVEDALQWQIPPNAELIRNLMIAAQFVHDHVMHFYHLHALDWVDVVSALDADPKQTSVIAQSISSYPKSSPGYFADTQKRLKAFVEGGQLGIFGNGYWGHAAYRLPPELNLLAVAHYLEALAWQRDIAKIHTIFGGRNPHPNFVVGGAPAPISIDPSATSGGAGATTLNVVALQQVRDLIARARTFVDQVLLPDVVAIASHYKAWFKRGEGVGNFMTYGDLPENGIADPSRYFIPAGVILDRDLSRIHPLDRHDPEQINEFVAHSWYDYAAGKGQGLHPYDGETTLNYTGPQPPYRQLDIDRDYSWLKSPRWRGRPMEVGPLARVLMLYAHGHGPTRELTDATLRRLDVPIEALFSTLGRTAARALETKLIGDQMDRWLDQLVANIGAGDLRVHDDSKWDPSRWPVAARGAGLMEAPRGALGHWIVIRDGRTANYQAVVPSTWNAGPRDAQERHGPYEAALMDNHELADATQPIEILRTIHSFDPCIACAVHIADPHGEELIRIRVV